MISASNREKKPVPQIQQRIGQISHVAPFCQRKWEWCIVGFVDLLNLPRLLLVVLEKVVLALGGGY